MIKYSVVDSSNRMVERNNQLTLWSSREEAEDGLDCFLSTLKQRPVYPGEAAKKGYKVKKVRIILEEL